MAGEWVQRSLGDLIEVKHGFAFQGEFISEEPRGDILLTPGNFAIGGGFKGDKFKYYNGPVPDDFVLCKGDLLVTMTDLSKQSDTLGFPAFVPVRSDGRRYLHNQRLGKVHVRDTSVLNELYLSYLLRSVGYRSEVLASATGTTVKHTSPERIRKFKFLLPPLDEQRSIAHILGTLDDKIELNRRMSETLEGMARALFKSWFVDFDPVRAKLGGRWQRGKSLPGLPAHLYDLFPDRLVDSELGEIPEGWEVGQFGDVVTQRKEAVNPSESPETRFAHFSLPAFDDGQAPKLELGGAIKSNKWKVSPDSVLLSKLNPEIDRTWLVDVSEGDNAICSTEFLVLVPRKPFTRTYVYCLTRSQSFRQHIESLVTGTSKSHQRAQADAVFGLEIALPSESIVEAFSQVAERALARTLVMKRESRALTALRDTLLPKLISGELRVAAKIVVEKVLS